MLLHRSLSSFAIPCLLAFGISVAAAWATTPWPNAVWATAVWATPDDAPSDSTIVFNRDIRPILSDACFACHGPDGNSRQADLRLDERQSAIDHGALVPQDPDTSSILERILSDDPDLVMPPPKTGKKITPEQRNTLRRWIASGAPYQSHWAYEPVPQQVPIPTPTPTLRDWIRNDIDAYTLDAMQKNGMQPADEADRLRWLRRVRLDLTGLPPTLEEIRNLMADDSESARERMVDQLLDSDAYAERMANLWLDVSRYADTFGYQADVNMDVWPWRDWLIRAFAQNLPYDQFLTWQIAGDLLPNATDEQRLATTFNRLHRQTNEGGSIEEEFRKVYVADRTVTAGTAFLGLTLECSRCHDHKYDPITQKEFYSFAAYFADIDEHGLYSHFTRATPTPALSLYTPEQKQQHQHLLESIAATEKQLAEFISQRSKLETNASSAVLESPATLWTFPLDGTEPGVFGSATRFNGDDAISFPLNRPNPNDETKPIQHQLQRPEPFSISLWVKPAQHAPRVVLAHQSVAAEDAAFRGLQLVLEQGKPQFSLIHFWPGDAIRVEALDAIPLDAWSQLGVTYDGSSRAAGIQLFINGERVATKTERDQLSRDFRYRSEWGDSNANSVALSLGARFRDIGFRDGCIDQLSVFDRSLALTEMAALYADAPSVSSESKAALTTRIATVWDPSSLRGDPKYERIVASLTNLRQQENELVVGVRQIMAMQPAIKPRTTHLLERGAYDAPRDAVMPQTPARLTTPETGSSTDTSPTDGHSPRNRLHLTQWMLADNNPLTSRVAVNRFWAIFFGRGIVASLEDFGSQGQVPTHPELLDALARDFISHGWDIKRLCKQIVLSATYRQSSTHRDPSWDSLDPDNRWLARGPRHRLSAEQVRDAALAATGLLVPTVGGPSVMPYQPPGLWEEAGTGKSYQQATGDGLYRRSMYTFWRRTAPPPSMLAFDATSRETCTARRETTTTPLQALVLLNDPQYIEAARTVAESTIHLHSTNRSERWNELALRLLNRPLTPAEHAILNDGFAEQLTYFQSHPESTQAFLKVGNRPFDATLDPAELAATTVVAETLLCFDDFVMKR
jgi:mono/diheme cytochrome c family protein